VSYPTPPPVRPHPELDQVLESGRTRTAIPQSDWTFLDYEPAQIKIHAGTPIERDWRANACKKEPWTVAWLETLTPQDRLFNVGANVGSYALIAAKRGTQTFAFEPGFHNYAALCANTLANELGGQLIPLPFALGAKTGWQIFGYPSTETGSAGLVPNARQMALNHLMLRLDDAIQLYGIGQPTALLIDVDGAEAGVLQGAERALWGVRTLLIEMDKDPASNAACFKMIEAAGLKLTQRIDKPEQERFASIFYALFTR
jgi:FkbM family methyltransferase